MPQVILQDVIMNYISTLQQTPAYFGLFYDPFCLQQLISFGCLFAQNSAKA